MKTLKLMSLTILMCACFIGFAPRANALAVNDASFLGGVVTSGTPASEADRLAYVNYVIGLDLFAIVQTQTTLYYRSGNSFGSLPQAVLPGNVSGSSTSIDLGTGGTYLYLFAQYVGTFDPSLQSRIWYVGDLSGTISIPALLGLDSQPLISWTLFAGEGPAGVPDGGSTIALLALALAGTELFRRSLRLRAVRVAKD